MLLPPICSRNDVTNCAACVIPFLTTPIHWYMYNMIHIYLCT